MLSATHRVAVIIGMWLSVAVGLFAVGVYGSETGRDVGWLFVVTLLITVFTTVALSGALPGFSFGSSEAMKAKREPDSSLEVLLGMMSQDERAAFKEALKQRILERVVDGELAPGAEMLEALEQEELSRHRR